MGNSSGSVPLPAYPTAQAPSPAAYLSPWGTIPRDSPLRTLFDPPDLMARQRDSWASSAAGKAQQRIDNGEDPRAVLEDAAGQLAAGLEYAENAATVTGGIEMISRRDSLLRQQAQLAAAGEKLAQIETAAEAERQQREQAEAQRQAQQRAARRRMLAADDGALPGWVRDRLHGDGADPGLVLDDWERAIAAGRDELKPEQAEHDALRDLVSGAGLDWQEGSRYREVLARARTHLDEMAGELDRQAEILDARREALAWAGRERTPQEQAAEQAAEQNMAQLAAAYGAVAARLAERDNERAARAAAEQAAAAAEAAAYRKRVLAGTEPLPRDWFGHILWLWRRFGDRPFLASDAAAAGHDDPDWVPPPGFRADLNGSAAARELGTAYAGTAGKDRNGAWIERAYSSGNRIRWRVRIDGT